MTIALDHLVIAAPTLEAGAQHVTDALGVTPQPGGAHPGMGTHNCLLGLFGGIYLEVIAIDPEAPAPTRIPPVIPMTRGDLRWRITVPQDGSLPAWPADDADGTDGPATPGDGILPTLIQWDVSTHPSSRLPNQGLALRSLRARHPQAARLAEALQWLGGTQFVPEASTLAELSAEIETPDGVRTLR